MNTTLFASAILATLASTTLAQTWTQVTPGTSPATRRDGGMAYDLINSNVLLYGGLLSPTAINNETWSFDGTNWTQLFPTTTPPPRWGHRCVLDTRRGRIVTFGGRSPTTTATANDTWEWDGMDWQQVITPVSPSARAFYSMAFDDRRGVTIIFGGQTNPVGSQLWEYDGATWSQVILPNAPLGRDQPVLVYDKARGVTVLFGGWNASSPGTMYNDTWEYDGSSWTLRTTANSPIARYRSAFWYDDARGRVVVYGGLGNGTALTDTWEYDGNDWTQVAAAGPARNTEPFAAYDPARRLAYHFGGSGPTGNSQETWLYSGPQTAIFAPFGLGCPGGNGTPMLGANPPVLGQPFVLNIGNLGNQVVGGLLLQGFTSTSFAGTFLPLDLSPFGMTGCRLEVAPATTSFLLANNGNASFGFVVPNQPSLTGLHYFTQFMGLDFAAPNGSVSMSNAGHALLGL